MYMRNCPRGKYGAGKGKKWRNWLSCQRCIRRLKKRRNFPIPPAAAAVSAVRAQNKLSSIKNTRLQAGVFCISQNRVLFQLTGLPDETLVREYITHRSSQIGMPYAHFHTVISRNIPVVHIQNIHQIPVSNTFNL